MPENVLDSAGDRVGALGNGDTSKTPQQKSATKARATTQKTVSAMERADNQHNRKFGAPRGQGQSRALQRTSHNDGRPTTPGERTRCLVGECTCILSRTVVITMVFRERNHLHLMVSKSKDLTQKNELYTWNQNASQVSDLSVFVASPSKSARHGRHQRPSPDPQAECSHTHDFVD